MRILGTGLGGYLGSVLTPLLLDAGHHVTVLETFAYNNDTTLAQFCSHPRFDIHRVDCRDVSAVKPFLTKTDALLPLAALVGAPISNLNPLDADLLNRVSLIELFKHLSRDQLVLNPSTESVYGKQAAICTEETVPAPLVTYGTQKLEVERALEDRGPNGMSFRMATLFGMSNRMRLDLLVNDLTWKAVKERSITLFEGGAMRTCLHVVDAARAFVHALTLEHSQYRVMNLGSIFVSKRGLCDAIKTQVPEVCVTEADYLSDPDKRDYTVSDVKFRATGYEPTMTLDDGIRELLVGYRGLSNSRHSNMP